MFMETVLNTSRQFDWQNNEPVAGSGTKNNLADAGTHSTSIHQLTYLEATACVHSLQYSTVQ